MDVPHPVRPFFIYSKNFVMKCLNNYVGLKTNQSGLPVAPLSGVYINSLPGITTDMFNKIAEKEDVTHLAVWNNIQVIAGHRIYSDAVSRLSKRFELKSTSEHVDIRPDVNAAAPDQQAAAAEERGLKIQFRRRTATFEAISIEKVYFHAPSAFNGRIRIRNAFNVVLHESAAIDFVEGINEIPIDEMFADDSIFIGVTVDNGPTYNSKITQSDRSCFCQTVQACHTAARPSIHGATFNGLVLVDDGDIIHGIGLTGYFVCDYSSIICNNKKLFLSTWMFLLGNQICVEVLGSGKINQHTTVDREQYEQLRDHYQVEYERNLETVIEGIRIPKSCCVECKSDLKRVPWRP